MPGNEKMGWIDGDGVLGFSPRIGYSLRTDGEPGALINHRFFQADVLDDLSEEGRLRNRAKASGRDESRPGDLVFPARKLIGFKEPVFERPFAIGIRVNVEPSLGVQDLVSHQIRDAVKLDVPHLVHVPFIDPFPGILLLVAPDLDFVARVELLPGIDAVLGALGFVSDPDEVEFFGNHEVKVLK